MSLSQLHQELQRDTLAADLRFSLFVGALNNFKYESLLKPIPIQFKNSDGEVDIDRLRQLTARLPGFQKLTAIEDELTPEEASLLKNVLLNNNQYQLSSISLSDFKEQVLTSEKLSFQTAPQWIFKIDYNSTRNEVWEKWKQSASTFYAFHGSRFENFHSILNLGLHQHLNKTSLFGEGIYLSTEHSLSLHYSPCGEGWMKSQLGCELSVLALCEVIDHPDVKRQGTTSRRDSVPEKYILVTNNELVRPRYLLVYTRPKNKTKLMAINFWQKHKFVLLMAVYASLLIGIGFAKKVVV